MHFLNEIQKLFIRTCFTLFNIYVDVYIWVQNKGFLHYFYSSNVKYIEPVRKEWICISSLYYNHKYDMCNTFLEEYTDIESEYKDYCCRKKNIYTFDSYEVREHIFISKRDDAYFIRTFFPGYKPSAIIDIIQLPSNVDFTYVEYTHPKMTSILELSIPNGMWIIGNELFTPAFILRLLQHQSIPYVFDLDYKINIMDHAIKNITLTYQSYIVVDKDDYIIQYI